MTQFELMGVHHLALVSDDMQRTVHFYTEILGLPLIKTIDLPFGGQHFFFDIGDGDSLAFFWFPKRKDSIAGVSSPRHRPDDGNFTSAPASMNHVAIEVSQEKIEEYRNRLVELGVECSPIMNHDESESQMAESVHPGVWLRSIYFWDPDGVLLEFAAWTRKLSPSDALVLPMDKNGNKEPSEYPELTNSPVQSSV
jgi:catechol 2,3-dioxygenase-like lactoylglutathione lyase family enzyme